MGDPAAEGPATAVHPVGGGLRFAFYGRMSTADFQDRASSCRWQRNYAEDLVADHGRIVVEFFDEGVSRRVAWPDRPQAARLLAAVAEPARGFDAIVVGEYERAFHGQQLEHLTPTLLRHGVQLWLPEAYGPVDFDNPRQLALLDLLGVHSQREVSRARQRTTAAMRAQAELQGRHLGGRPPYGYRLVDAGPHPNRAHAAWGRRLHRLEPDPATAPWVRWIFEQRLAGRSVAGIARRLNDNGVPCPSGADPARNRHRSGQGWMLTTVAAILANPRYTGRQVWNRQRTDHDGIEPDSTITRHREVQRWNGAPHWILSRTVAHPPLVSEEQFLAAQAIHTAPTPTDGTPRHYLLAGLVCCGVCGRIMDSHWVHDRPGYRCRHGHTSTRTNTTRQPKILYIREDHLLDRIRHDRGLHRHHPALRSPDPEKVATYLRTKNMIIVCDTVPGPSKPRPRSTRSTLREAASPPQQKSPPSGTGITRKNTNNYHASCENNVSEIRAQIRGTHAQHGCSCRNPIAVNGRTGSRAQPRTTERAQPTAPAHVSHDQEDFDMDQ